MRAILFVLAVVAAGAASAKPDPDPSGTDVTTHMVLPSDADTGITRFDNPSIVSFRPGGDAQQLVLFLTGTGGVPRLDKPPALKTALDQGYRVVNLEFNTTPAVVQKCINNPDPDCSAKFRQQRIYGDIQSDVIDDTRAEAIIPRFVALLKYLEHQYPNEHWDRYISGDGPNWSMIVVAGQSQGSGMAAYIAKREPVARVVMFSCGWDNYGEQHALAPWFAGPSVTPPDRWYGTYNKGERAASLIAQIYKVMNIPEEHVVVFDKDLQPTLRGRNLPNPYHIDGISNPAYAADWKMLFGVSP